MNNDNDNDEYGLVIMNNKTFKKIRIFSISDNEHAEKTIMNMNNKAIFIHKDDKLP